VVTGCTLGVAAAFAGGPLGNGRLTAVGPSGWQAGLVTTLEVGVAAAVTAGLVNWLRLRREPDLASGLASQAAGAEGGDVVDEGGDDGGHRIYLDPWADDEDGEQGSHPPPSGPASLPPPAG
jgi:hypothetical protein